jgi:hypothetical protein
MRVRRAELSRGGRLRRGRLSRDGQRGQRRSELVRWCVVSGVLEQGECSQQQRGAAQVRYEGVNAGDEHVFARLS